MVTGDNMTYWVGLDPKTRVHVTSMDEARKLAIAMLNNGYENVNIPIYTSASGKKPVGWMDKVSKGHYNFIKYDSYYGAQVYAVRENGKLVR